MVRQVVVALLVWLVLCGAAFAGFRYVTRRPKSLTEHADEAMGLTAPPDAAVINAGHVELSEREALAFDDLVKRFHGSFYVPGPEVSDD